MEATFDLGGQCLVALGVGELGTYIMQTMGIEACPTANKCSSVANELS